MSLNNNGNISNKNLSLNCFVFPALMHAKETKPAMTWKYRITEQYDPKLSPLSETTCKLLTREKQFYKCQPTLNHLSTSNAVSENIIIHH